MLLYGGPANNLVDGGWNLLYVTLVIIERTGIL